MRQIVLDTETTGLSWEKGNRVVEIGCVELIERRPTGRTFQRYLKPDCVFEPGAQEVTGLSLDFLADKPLMQDVVDEFLDFVRGAELIIHVGIDTVEMKGDGFHALAQKGDKVCCGQKLQGVSGVCRGAGLPIGIIVQRVGSALAAKHAKGRGSVTLLCLQAGGSALGAGKGVV